MNNTPGWQFFIKKISIFIPLLLSLSCSSPQKTAEIENPPLSGHAETAQEKGVVVSEFILGVGDEIDLTVYRHDDLNKKVRISPDGTNTFPLIGAIQTKGTSIHYLRGKIKDALSVYLVDPQVSLEITSFRGQKIFILGEVNTPGVYQIDTPTTIIEAIAKAGGYTLDGKYSSVMLIRNGQEKPELKRLDLKKTFATGDLSQNVFLKSGDVVYVPRTFIADVDRFFKHFENIVRPLAWTEQGIILGDRIDTEVFQGARSAPTQIVITPP
ncbi:MAG: polysaccharide export protein [Candidatus Brocadia sp.]|nr:polysaccharide export protein [Candidatus Brocadia sp.]MDG6025574.1 polysaccharide export protein [Candidatus Brocadia sp.]